MVLRPELRVSVDVGCHRHSVAVGLTSGELLEEFGIDHRPEGFAEVARYVVLNPVRARMVRSASDYPWSSYRAMTGEDAAPEWLETRAILAAFGQTEAQAEEGYQSFIAAGKGQPSPGSTSSSRSILARTPSWRPCNARSRSTATYAKCPKPGESA